MKEATIEAQRAEIVACHVIEVPMALPLTTDLTAEEQHGNEVLDRAVRLMEEKKQPPLGRHPETMPEIVHRHNI